MLFVVLSILDVLAGAAIYSPGVFSFLTKMLWTLTVIILFKGVYSIASSFSSGYYLEWPGALDIIAGLTLFLMSYDLVKFSHIVGGLIISKGSYFLIRSILKI